MKHNITIMLFVVGTAALCVTGGSAHSQQPKDSALVGGGSFSCAVFGQEYKTDPEGTENVYFTWAQGWMSGLNSALYVHKQPMSNLALWDLATQEQHVRSYCNVHPLAFYMEAVLSLFEAMRRQQGLPAWR